MPADVSEVAAVARELYAHVPAEFVVARNARAAEVRRAGDRGLATEVKALPRATAAAWAVAAVVRECPEELDALGELGAELRVAQAAADPAELRALGKRRRELTGAATSTAARLADECGLALSAAARDQVESTWQAVVIDPRAERAVRSMLLVRALEPGEAPGEALAVAGAAPATEEPGTDEPADPTPQRPTPQRPTPLRRAAVSSRDEDEPAAPSRAGSAREVRRAERELRARERVAEQAQRELAEAGEQLSRVEAEVLQAAARTEELRRELETLEDRLADLDEERTEAREEHEDAESRVEAARGAVAEAQERLTGLTG